MDLNVVIIKEVKRAGMKLITDDTHAELCDVRRYARVKSRIDSYPKVGRLALKELNPNDMRFVKRAMTSGGTYSSKFRPYQCTMV